MWLGRPEKCEEKYPKNAIKNQKYNIVTFVPGVRQYKQSLHVFLVSESAKIELKKKRIFCLIFVKFCIAVLKGGYNAVSCIQSCLHW